MPKLMEEIIGFWLGAFMTLGAVLVFVNIFIAQKLMGWFTKKVNI